MDFLEQTIRKWLLTICSELQISVPKIVIRSEIPSGEENVNTYAFARGGQIHLNSELLNLLSEEDILFTLAHELRHQYQKMYFNQWFLECYYKKINKKNHNLVNYGTGLSFEDYYYGEEEIDANTYANEFIKRNIVPYGGTYIGEIFFPNEIGKLISARDFRFVS